METEVLFIVYQIYHFLGVKYINLLLFLERMNKKLVGALVVGAVSVVSGYQLWKANQLPKFSLVFEHYPNFFEDIFLFWL